MQTANRPEGVEILDQFHDPGLKMVFSAAIPGSVPEESLALSRPRIDRHRNHVAIDAGALAFGRADLHVDRNDKP